MLNLSCEIQSIIFKRIKKVNDAYVWSNEILKNSHSNFQKVFTNEAILEKSFFLSGYKFPNR